MSQAYANELEQMFASLPQVMQEALHEPFTWMNDALKSVAGRPEDLVAAGSGYVVLGDAIHQLCQRQREDRAMLVGHWRGETYDAFIRTMDHTETQLDKVAEAVKQNKEVLDAGAQACVDGANMIIDIVKSLLMFAIGSLVISAALSVVTVGASMAAGVAAVVARALIAVARVARVVQKLSQLLMKIAGVLNKLAVILRELAAVLRQINAVLAEARALAKTSKGWDMLGARISAGVQHAVVGKGIAAVTVGAVTIPGGLGLLGQAAGDYVDGWGSASDAQDDAERR